MKKLSCSTSGLTQGRSLLALVLCFSSLLLAFFTIANDATAKSLHRSGKNRVHVAAKRSTGAVPADAIPPGGTLDPAHPSITYTDGPLAPNPTGILGAPDCTAPNSCSDFMVTVNASSLAATHNLTWLVQWTPQNVDQDIFIEDANHNLIANNNSTADPSAIILPIPADGTVYHLVVAASVGTAPLNGSISLTKKFPAAPQGAGAPPRYMNYPAAPNQANGDNEPSMGVDWNPNVPGLQDFTGQTRLNTAGVAMFTRDTEQWRTNFDDCSSPAVNVWQDTNAPIVTGLDPIGFVDHFVNQPLGLGPNPPQTPGRIFALDLAAGTSTAAFSDDDGNSWTSILAGNYPAGVDHETLGGGPFHAPIPSSPAYPNAIYYCSQNGVQNAECSRSDDGGVTYGPGVPMFDPTMCGGGIHGHVKVSPQGTVYVPNSSCAVGNPPGSNGVAVSADNGITWTQRTVPGSTGSQDPAIGIGQNSVGKPAGQVPNTIYLGWVSGDGHAHVAHSPDEGVTWQDDTDVSSIVGSENSVFPVVVAGDDNRAAYGFLGTDSDYAPKKVWHLYIATTYDAGKSWIVIDATPNDPVQIGEVCLLGIGCNGARNLLDFNGIDIDKEGRVLIGYTDGCVNCSNTQNITQSTQGHGTIARQSGGRRLFKFFDPVEPGLPAAPQAVSAVRQDATKVVVSWLVPDNGGSPITGYNIYRGTTAGSETLYAHVDGEQTTKFVDTAAPTSSNWFYRITAINGVNEGDYCRELNVNGAQPIETACQLPYLTLQTDPTGDQTGAPNTNQQFDIERVSMGEPFVSCTDKSITFLMKVASLSPAALPNGAWRILFNAKDTNGATHQLYVQMDTQLTPTPEFEYGFIEGTSGTTQFCPNTPGFVCPVSGSTNADGTITIKLDVSNPLDFFSSTNTTSTPDFTVSFAAGKALSNVEGQTLLLVGAAQSGELVEVDSTGTNKDYTMVGNLSCVQAPPLAALTATPLSGPAPLNVDFDAAASTDPNPCTTITKYTLDFGDGSPAESKSTPTFSHMYNNPGDYAARLTVTDSGDQVSNTAQVVIHVTGQQIQYTGVVSRKVHGPAGALDLILPTDGSSAVECRAPGNTEDPNADYELIFVFPNELANVQQVAATSTGSAQPDQPTGAIGTNKHQYIVKLTNVPDQQFLTVTLTNVTDLQGLSGNVSITLGMLEGDVDGSGHVDADDITVEQRDNSKSAAANLRADVDVSGHIDVGDLGHVQRDNSHSLPGLR